MADGKFLGRDHALGLVADVDEDLVAVHLHHGAGEDVAFLEGDQAVLDRLPELFRRQVVLHGLHGCRRGRVLRCLDLDQLLSRSRKLGPHGCPRKGDWVRRAKKKPRGQREC